MRMLASLFVLFNSFAQLATTQGFAGTCNAMTANLTENWLGMYCYNLNTASFGYNWTWIDLNWCLGNNGGSLMGMKDGGFPASCYNCKTAPNGRWPDGTLDLTCACRDPNGNSPGSTMDLNTVISNSDGTMGCFGHWGSKTLRGPN